MNKIVFMANLVFLALASYLGVRAFYVLAADRMIVDAIPGKSAALAPVAEDRALPQLSDYDAIGNRDLFKVGNAAPAPPPPPPPKAEVPVEKLQDTRLNLKLWGTVTGLGGKTYAVIEDPKTREQNLYRVGDTVQTARVKKVLREKVILNVKGRDEILKIIELAAAGRGRQTRAPAYASPARRAVSPGKGEQVTIEQSRIDSATRNLNQLMKGVRIRPHFSNGQPDGIRLSGIKPGSIFTDIGFKSGDIIVGVNGEQIESVDDALKFYSSLKSANNVSLQIRRNGVEQTIEYVVE